MTAYGVTPPMSEDQLLTAVLDLAAVLHWRCLHIRPARTARGWASAVQADGVGWPDVFLVRRDRALAFELKSPTGRVSPEQVRWLADLNAAGIPARVMRPADWPTIVKLLR